MDAVRRRRSSVLLWPALVLSSVVAFVPACWSGFLADDFILLRTLDRFDGVAWAFTHNDLGADEGHFYRPLWVLWHVGMDALPGAAGTFHAGNLLLYAVVVLEVWLLARRLAGEGAAWVASFGFAVYPRHGESVAWISGSTDLLAAALVLPAVLCAIAPWRPGRRAAAAAPLAAAAALAKESAFVAPLLAAVGVWLVGRDRRRWLAPAAMAVSQALVLAARTAVVGGAGGYADYPWTPVRLGGVASSYVAAALSPPQLELLRFPALLVLPAALLALALWRVRALRRAGDRARVRVAAGGALWFAVALLPALNLAVDLNLANGERLLFLPSVGLAVAFGALAPAARAALVLAGAAALALCVWSATNWAAAERIAGRVVASAERLAPPGGELVVLAVPENYRTAHVFPGVTLGAALERAGRRDVRVAACAPVYVRSDRAGAVSAAPAPGGAIRLRATWDAPFDVPVLRDASQSSADCRFDADDGWPPGLELDALVYPAPSRQPVVLAYFDGHDLRPLEWRFSTPHSGVR
ncbi:MAG: hypothetical protein ICV64_11610 [Thermoleophilia bacterium]|nr:hypothetical protein [Thermoleophilia bacterium]